MFSADVEPFRLREVEHTTVKHLVVCLAANASDCRIGVRRWIALRVDPLDLADGRDWLPGACAVKSLG
jgi:hypothetical protein